MSARSRRALHLVLLFGSLAVVLASVLLGGDGEAVYLFGEPLPPICTIKRLTGFDCPGCGLTRSFVFMGHGAVLDAFRMHLLGPLMWVLVAAQVPYRLLRLIQGWTGAGGGNAAATGVSP